MTNVLFIVPPLLPLDSQQWETVTALPLGLLSIASYVEKHVQVDFKILDLVVESPKRSILEDLLKKAMLELYDEPPDIVGISAIFNSNMGYLYSISRTIKQLWSETLVVVGGGAPTILYKEVFDIAPDIDAAAIGEGENPFLELVQAAHRKQYLQTAPGWMTRDRTDEPCMDMLSDLDEIPPLRYDLVELNSYQDQSRYHGDKSENPVIVSIMTSRGCPFRCTFCVSHTIHGRKIRRHSPDRIIGDIRKVKEEYGVNTILIEDDLFLSDKRNALVILRSLEGMTIEFPNGLSVQHLDEEIIDALIMAGMKMATIAVESGCERVLNEIIRKPYGRLSKVQDVTALLRKKKVYVRAFFIIGFPGETMEEIEETISFMKSVGFNWNAIMIATPLKGSELYAHCKDNDLLISDKLEDFHFGKCNIKLPHSTPQEMEDLRYRANLEVNFIENYDLVNGYPEIALIGFQDVISRVPNHAFAYYYASLCYRMMDQTDLGKACLEKYEDLLDSSSEWRKYSALFNLPV